MSSKTIRDITIVGILNTTPDSFSDGGLYVAADAAAQRATELFRLGADIIDIGAESTNPNKTEAPLTPDEETARLLPLLAVLMPRYPGKISIDSHHPETIQAIVDKFGNNFIANDVTGMNNPLMRHTVAANGLTTIISHLPARFGTDIQAGHKDATLDDASVVLRELLQRRQELLNLGLESDKIILDPGIGFAKTMRLNWELLQFADAVHAVLPNTRVLLGFSRKRFLLTNENTGLLLPQFAENPRDESAWEWRKSKQANTSAAHIAIQSGANMLRVHDPELY